MSQLFAFNVGEKKIVLYIKYQVAWRHLTSHAFNFDVNKPTMGNIKVVWLPRFVVFVQTYVSFMLLFNVFTFTVSNFYNVWHLSYNNLFQHRAPKKFSPIAGDYQIYLTYKLSFIRYTSKYDFPLSSSYLLVRLLGFILSDYVFLESDTPSRGGNIVQHLHTVHTSQIQFDKVDRSTKIVAHFRPNRFIATFATVKWINWMR